MPKNKSDDCSVLGLAKNFYKTYNQTKIDNPISTGNKTIDKLIFNPITKAVPYIGPVVQGADSINKAYQTGGFIARRKAVYDDCQKKTKK